MFISSKKHRNLIPHSKELHDMLLEGYRHAIFVECDEARTLIEQASDEEGSKGKGGYSKLKKTPKLSAADVLYEFDRDGMIFRIEGFEDKEAARMAYEERLELLERKEFKKEEQEHRIRLLDLKKHLGPELKNE